MSVFEHDLEAAAKRVKAECDERGWSGFKLSREAKVGDGVIARVEAAESISAASRKKIADALDLKVNEIWPLIEVQSDDDERRAA